MCRYLCHAVATQCFYLSPQSLELLDVGGARHAIDQSNGTTVASLLTNQTLKIGTVWKQLCADNKVVVCVAIQNISARYVRHRIWICVYLHMYSHVCYSKVLLP